MLTPNMTRRRFHPTMEMIPALSWQSRNPSTPIKQSIKQGDTRGTSEVPRGTSSIHFHCRTPQSSNHIGHRKRKMDVMFKNGARAPKTCQLHSVQKCGSMLGLLSEPLKVSRTLKSTHKIEWYLNRGFPGVRKGGIKGEVGGRSGGRVNRA